MSADGPMWKAEFRPMTREERAELRRMLEGASDQGSWIRRLFGRASKTGPQQGALHRDLDCGKVQVIHAAAGAAVRLSHSDGSLAGFFVDIGQGLLMYIESREWDRHAGEPGFEHLFPCSRFSLVRAPHSGVDLEFCCEGLRFEPAREIEAPPLEILDAFIQDGEIMPGRLETLEEDLDRLTLRSPRVRTSPA